MIFGASKGGHLGFGHIWGGTIEQILVNFLSWLIDLFSYPFQLRNKIKQFFPTSAAYLLDYSALLTVQVDSLGRHLIIGRPNTKIEMSGSLYI